MFLVRVFVPLSTIASTPFIIPARLRRLEAHKRLFFRRYGPQSMKYKRLDKLHLKSIHEFSVSWENEMLHDDNKLKFFSFMKNKLRPKKDIGDLVHGDRIVTHEHEEAEIFADYFASVYTVDDGVIPHLPPFTDVPFLNVDFSPLHVRQALQSLKGKLSLGSDLLPALFYKRLGKSLVFPLCLLFEKSLYQSSLPDSWRLSTVVPIHKKGPKGLPQNYRPISKQATILKIAEKVVMGQLLAHMSQRPSPLLSEFQFGFRPKRSVTQQLLLCLDHWTANFGLGIHVAFLDYSKAFDTVSHPKLLQKLAAYGVGGPVLEWFRAYLSNRRQRVQVNSAFSSFAPITSGILQGSCLGPVAFLIYLNDIANVIPDGVRVALFADDVKLFSTDPGALQSALNAVQKWSLTWQLTLSEQKCTVMHISPVPFLPAYPFRLSNHVLEYSSCTRDLGVLLAHNLDFSFHYASLVQKASLATYNVCKCFVSGRPLLMAKAFIIYVRPILESFAPVWCPVKAADIASLERVQRRFTWLLYKRCGIPDAPYAQRLAFLGLDTLQSRRLRLDLAFAHKIYNTKSSTVISSLLSHHSSNRPLRASHRLVTDFNPKGPRKHFFPNRIRDSWNSLPTATVSLSHSAFKRKIPVPPLQ
jgi:hypothetical protein